MVEDVGLAATDGFAVDSWHHSEQRECNGRCSRLAATLAQRLCALVACGSGGGGGGGGQGYGT